MTTMSRLHVKTSKFDASSQKVKLNGERRSTPPCKGGGACDRLALFERRKSSRDCKCF